MMNNLTPEQLSFRAGYEQGRFDAQVEAAQQQELVAWTLLLVGEHHGLVGKAGEKFVGHPEYYERVDVFKSPPTSKPWVGLTDEERAVIVEANTTDDHGYDIWCDGNNVARVVEAKLKEKNTQ